MNYYGNPVSKLVEELSRLPGIGSKSAQRLAFHIINLPKEEACNLATAIIKAKKDVKYCSVCCNFSDGDICPICADTSRDQDVIMVVEDPKSMAAYERTREFKGVYHILHGVISPMAGIGPSDIKIKELLERIKSRNIEEVIIATNPKVEGEATAMYISKILKPLDIKVTRIANGVPVGGEIEYIDEVTLLRALEGRREM